MPRRAERTIPLPVVPLLAAVLFASACASNPSTPPGWLTDAETAVRDPWGGWAIVEETSTRRAVGELIAVHADSIFLLPESGRFVGLDREGLGKAVVIKYRPPTRKAWFLLGGVATISNGAFLLFTAPMWAVGGILSTRSENEASRVEIPPRSWDDAARWSRFPQGLPPGLDRRALAPKRRR